MSQKFVPKVRIDNIPSPVQRMAWRRPGDKPLSKSMVSLLRHLCVTRPQWVKLILLISIKMCSYMSVVDIAANYVLKNISICTILKLFLDNTSVFGEWINGNRAQGSIFIISYHVIYSSSEFLNMASTNLTQFYVCKYLFGSPSFEFWFYARWSLNNHRTKIMRSSFLAHTHDSAH